MKFSPIKLTINLHLGRLYGLKQVYIFKTFSLILVVNINGERLNLLVAKTFRGVLSIN